MQQFRVRHCKGAAAAAATAAAVTLLSHCDDEKVDVIVARHRPVVAALTERRSPRRRVAIPFAPRTSSPSLARCESIRDVENQDNDDYFDDADDDNVGYYYSRMNPTDVERTSLSDSHAIFGALMGRETIERYDVYRRVYDDVGFVGRKSPESPSRREMVVVNFRVGNKLNGHGGIVHGGILSLLFDEAMGWAYECLRREDESIDDPSSPVTAVTANLTIDFRAPFVEGSEGVIRVYFDERKGRKIYFTATLESKDGGVTYAEARSLFVLVGLDRLKNK